MPSITKTSSAYQTLTARAQAVPDLLQDLANLSDTTVRRSVVAQEDLKPYWKSWKDQISHGNLQVF